jgi:hypothetical protein
MDVPDGPDGLARNDLMKMLHMVFGIAAFRGTSGLAMSCLTQMPEGCAAEVIRDEDNVCSRLNAHVTSDHCIVDDELSSQMTLSYALVLSLPISTRKGTPISLYLILRIVTVII